MDGSFGPHLLPQQLSTPWGIVPIPQTSKFIRPVGTAACLGVVEKRGDGRHQPAPALFLQQQWQRRPFFFHSCAYTRSISSLTKAFSSAVQFLPFVTLFWKREISFFFSLFFGDQVCWSSRPSRGDKLCDAGLSGPAMQWDVRPGSTRLPLAVWACWPYKEWMSLSAFVWRGWKLFLIPRRVLVRYCTYFGCYTPP